jgi:uncharacterized protein
MTMTDLANASFASIENESRGTQLGSRVKIARSFWARGRGLMFRASLEEGSGLIIDPCGSIHSMWMRFPIDVLYVARDGKVIRADAEMKPWRIGPLFVRGKYVIELPTGTIARSKTEAGDQLSIRPM